MGPSDAGVEPRRYRAGDGIEDLCRACKVLREHRVLAVDGEGQLSRVVCGYCGSQHNYRGGERPRRAAPQGPASVLVPGGSGTAAVVTARERRYPIVNVDAKGSAEDLELLMRRVLREELGLTPVAISERWRGGEMVLRPGKPGLQEKSWPIEGLFHKIVMIRNKLRTLEQQVNAAEIPEDQKLRLQGYITGCYGSLTSFNLLFAEEEDRFSGSGGA